MPETPQEQPPYLDPLNFGAALIAQLRQIAQERRIVPQWQKTFAALYMQLAGRN
ncbi:MAG: hypothetical protein ACLPT6_13295 [Desulfobaccales bacterium]